MVIFNGSISVDCVIMGFDKTKLKVLLVEQTSFGNDSGKKHLKLPGSLIYNSEDLESAAYRVLKDMTGISNLYLKQLHVFSKPDRVKGSDLEWINKKYNTATERVMTVAYYSLIKLDSKVEQFTNKRGVEWVDLSSVKYLALDHKEILVTALNTLSLEFMQSPIAFELLPRKFTIRQLQNLYEAVLGEEIDNRNFRKKIATLGYLTPTTEKEKNVAHKPAIYYTFNVAKFEKEQKSKTSISRLYF